MASGLERWLGIATGHSRPGSNPTSVKTFRFGTLAIPFRPTLLCQCLSDETLKTFLYGVYARGSKISHHSALECVTVVDSTSHSKSPSVRICGAGRCPSCTLLRRRRTIFKQIISQTCHLVRIVRIQYGCWPF